MMAGRKLKKVRRERLSTKEYAAHAGERVGAVLYCLEASCGARKGVKAKGEGGAPLFPNTTLNVLDEALRIIKNANKPKGHWTKATVGTALFPAGRQQELNYLLTAREEQSLSELIRARGATSPPTHMGREQQRRAIRSTLLERQRRNKDSRYTARPLSPAAQKVVDQASNGGLLQFPTNMWFRGFQRRFKGIIWEKVKVTKCVKRMRSVDPGALHAEIDELVGDAVTLNITDEDGRWIEYPGEANDDGVGPGPGYCYKARTIQVDEKGEFIYYDRDKGGAARCKYAAAHGCQPLQVAQAPMHAEVAVRQARVPRQGESPQRQSPGGPGAHGRHAHRQGRGRPARAGPAAGCPGPQLMILSASVSFYSFFLTLKKVSLTTRAKLSNLEIRADFDSWARCDPAPQASHPPRHCSNGLVCGTFSL